MTRVYRHSGLFLLVKWYQISALTWHTLFASSTDVGFFASLILHHCQECIRLGSTTRISRELVPYKSDMSP